jgi:hypothetical protein
MADCKLPRHSCAENEGKAAINIHTFEIMEGTLPRRALNLVLDWAELHRAELLSDWDKCRIHQQPDKIEPLP